MAPIPPSQRDRKPLKSILKQTSQPSSFSSKPADSHFPTSKRHKRHIKHAQLVSKIVKQNTKSKRRRPSKKLVASLDSLADALPDNENRSKVAGKRPEDQVNIIKRKSLRSRPGALKRKQKLDNDERARFARNMAQMANVKETTGTPDEADGGAQRASSSNGVSCRWAALRSFIAQTLEKRDDFRAKQ
jgi:Ribosome biogenesis protein SLX9